MNASLEQFSKDIGCKSYGELRQKRSQFYAEWLGKGTRPHHEWLKNHGNTIDSVEAYLHAERFGLIESGPDFLNDIYKINKRALKKLIPKFETVPSESCSGDELIYSRWFVLHAKEQLARMESA